jgi:hypothetical protein
MKQKLFGAASLVAFILFGASCSNQEQSEFNLDSIQQKVTISATVTYSTGVDVNATSYSIVTSKPAAGRRVFIEIPYAQYTGLATTTGNKIFETVTDENGKFSITIPTTSTGITGTIRLEEFTDIFNIYEKMGADGKPIFKSELRNYKLTYAFPASALMPGGLQFPEELVYDNEKIDVDQFSNNVTMTGNVNLAYETGFRKGAFKPATNANVEFTIIYNASDPTKAFELKFGTTTDAQGNYSITLPVQSLADGFNIKAIKVLGIGESQFNHYDTDSTTIKVYGAYELQNFGNIPVGGSLAFKDIIDGVTYNLGAQNLLFTPYYNAGVTDAADAKPNNWDDKLIGWAAGMAGFDESYSKTATLTGKVYMPYLTSFGEGAYRNEPQTIVLTAATPYDKGLTVITDAQGNFSVDIPVQDDKAIDFSVKLAEEVQPFEFIDSKDKTIVLREGKYNSKTQIKKEGAEWYELGDFYFKYSPKDAEKPSEWNADLIGWYRSSEYDKPVQVKGKILFAVETSYGIGEYQPQTRIVSIKTNESPARTFAVKTKANGAFDFMIPLKNELDQPSLSLSSTSYETNEYVHFPKYNDNASKFLVVKYTKKATAYESKEDKEAWNNMGTTYMYVNASNVTNKPSTFNDNLAGWFIKTDDNDVAYQYSVRATGQALKAVETSFLTGEYRPAKGQLVKLSLYSTNISVLANNSGAFSFNVPLKNTGDETTITVSGTGFDEDHFEHYVNAQDKKKILDGSYTGESITSDDAEWNDLGTVYYKFSPKSPDAFWTNYTQYIAGWVYIKGRSVREQNVTGKAYLPYETSFRNGAYAPARRFPVKIQVGSSSPYTYYVTATDTLGNFSIPVWQKFAGDIEEIQWLDPVFKTEDLDMKFIHYRKPGTSTTEKLSGKIVGKQTIRKGDAKWHQRGERWYRFYDLADATLYTESLAGWAVKPLDWTHTLTIKGSVKQAAEKSDGSSYSATWENCSNNIFTVTVTGYGSYKVATNSSGAFQFNVYDTNTDEPASVSVSIALDEADTYFKNTAFKHFKTPTQQEAISGDYSKAPYTPGQNKEGTGTSFVYTMDHSFKLIFTPNSTPTNWGDFGWSSIYSED